MNERMEEGVQDSEVDLVKVGNRELWKHGLFEELERQNIGGDVILVAGGSRVHCHSTILAASSPLLKELLMEQNGEGESVLDLSDWGRRELELAVRLLHTGEVLLKPDEREVGERVTSLMSTLCVQGVEVGQFRCFRCNAVQPNLGDYLNHMDSDHVAQTVESNQNLMKELEDNTGDPGFEDWTCMGCFATDLLPVKKFQVVNSEAAALCLKNHLMQCTQAVEREKERVERMQEKIPSLGSILNNNHWRICPLCGDSKKSRDEMVSHLFYHPQLVEILDKSFPAETAYTCKDGCMIEFAGRNQFILHMLRNCETGAKRRLDLILGKLAKTDVMGEEQSDDGFSDISEDEVMEELEFEGDAEGGKGHTTIGLKAGSSGCIESKEVLPSKSSDASSQTSGNSDDFHIGKEEDTNVKSEDIQAPVLATTEQGIQTTDQTCLAVDQGCQTASETDDETKERQRSSDPNRMEMECTDSGASLSDLNSSGESKPPLLEVILEFGHTSTLRDAVDANVPGAVTHDWEAWVKNPSNDKIENFLEKVVFTLPDTFKDPKRIATSPPYKIQDVGSGSFKILIDIFFRAPKGERHLEKARVEYDLVLQPFKRPHEADFQKVLNIRRMERMTFPTRDENFKQRLIEGGAKLVESHRQITKQKEKIDGVEGQVKRRRVKKQVDKTYVDEDGYMVTKKVVQSASETDDELKQNCSVHETTQTVVNEMADKSCQTCVDDKTEPTPLPVDKKSQTENVDYVGKSDDEQIVKAHAPDNTTEEESSDIGDNVKRTPNRSKELVGESSVRCNQCHGIFETSSKYKSKIKHFCKFLGGKLSRCPQVEVGARSGAKRVTMTCSLCRFYQHLYFMKFELSLTYRCETRNKPVFRSDGDLLLHILISHKARFVKQQFEKGGARFQGVTELPAPCSFPG